jgi:hypothetical protein
MVCCQELHRRARPFHGFTLATRQPGQKSVPQSVEHFPLRGRATAVGKPIGTSGACHEYSLGYTPLFEPPSPSVFVNSSRNSTVLRILKCAYEDILYCFGAAKRPMAFLNFMVPESPPNL